MIEKAAGKKAMQPLIEASRAAAEEALAEGRIPDARREIERLRAADPKHPALPSFERRMSAPPTPAGQAPPGPRPGPRDSNEFALGGPQSEGYDATPAFGDLSSEPVDLDPFPPAPSDLRSAPSEGSLPRAGSPGLLGFDDNTSPEADALAPSSLPPHDMFLPAEEAPGTAVPSLPPPEFDEEEARATEREIGALIKQGDETAKKGDREQAIEIWSRVFLIDINNSEAVTRIEKARQEIADESRMVADCLKKGRESFEAGDREAARRFFLQAQSLDPGEPTAALYLERIEKGEADKATPGAAGAAPARAVVPASVDDFPEALPAAPAAAPPPRERRAGVPINARVLAVIGAFLALTLVGVYFVFKGSRTAQAPAQNVVSSGFGPARPGASGQGTGPGGADRVAPHRAERSGIGGSPQAPRQPGQGRGRRVRGKPRGPPRSRASPRASREATPIPRACARSRRKPSARSGTSTP